MTNFVRVVIFMAAIVWSSALSYARTAAIVMLIFIAILWIILEAEAIWKWRKDSLTEEDSSED